MTKAKPPAIAQAALILAGPTGVGKSELAVRVAEQCGGEIIGADAFQVYAGLPLLTAQPTAEQRARVRHHLVGEVPLQEEFNVARYLELAGQRMAEVRTRGRVPVVVGGTGLYLRALLYGLAELPGPDPTLRAELETTPLLALVEKLRALDPAGMAWIDSKNPRRVIRAIEVCLLTGRPFSSFREEWQAPLEGAPCGIVVTRPGAELHERIDRRVEAMFRAGVVEEVAAASEPGPTATQTLGWREIQALRRGEISPAECVEQIQRATRQYAKRQMTWFRKEAALQWCSVEDAGEVLAGLSHARWRSAPSTELTRR